MDLPVNEVRNALGHAVPRGPGERRGLMPHFVPPVRGVADPRARRAGDAVRALRDAARARPQHLENHASTSTARPISSESEMSGRTINTRLPMLMRSLGLSPCRLTAQYGSSPARRTSRAVADIQQRFDQHVPERPAVLEERRVVLGDRCADPALMRIVYGFPARVDGPCQAVVCVHPPDDIAHGDAGADHAGRKRARPVAVGPLGAGIFSALAPFQSSPTLP